MRIVLKSIVALLSLGLLGAAVVAGGTIYGLWHYGRDLPDYKQLADYRPPTATRVHAGDGRLIAEYARERRVFVPIQAFPRRVIHAFIAAEDKNFFSHPGVDFMALVRAVVTNLKSLGTDRRPVGASTLTQQVAKNFLLTNEVSIERKIKEAILAFRIERALSKERILELYLNEIYLGYGSYGVAAAALNYFNKSMDELTTAEAAYLAGLPKAPNNYHPIRKAEAARARRNYVIGRMFEDGFIDRPTAVAARAAPLVVVPPDETQFVDAAYFSEEVRRELVDRFGENALYEGGLSVRTTVDPRLQTIAEHTLRQGLLAYDRRHGWRGPVSQIELAADWPGRLAAVPPPPGIGAWRLALVLDVTAETADIGFADGSGGRIPFAELTWAREWKDDQKRGAKVERPADVLAPGDVVMVEPVTHMPAKEGEEPVPYPPGSFGLRQIPEINGGLVALDPHTGRVLAMAGGWSYEHSEFNRVSQAVRQPGSAFKPFVYLTALDQGYTPATLILDAPFVLDQGPGQGKWKPANFTRKFYGPSPMRVGIEKSRNLMTVRLAQAIGMDLVSRQAARFGIMDRMPEQLSMALGAGETSLLRLTSAYAMLVNGGREITPTLIDRVQDRNGRTIFRHDTRDCPGCEDNANDPSLVVPTLPDPRQRLTDPASAFQIVHMLEGVVLRGTGRRIRAVGKPLAGKTGTTNDSRDTWFVGFSPDLAVGVFMGLDTPRPLGRMPNGVQETGSTVAAPVFKDFMQTALENEPAIPFRIPAGLRMVRIDANTGLAARAGTKGSIVEAFKAGTEPDYVGEAVLIGDGLPNGPGGTVPASGESTTRGLY